MFVVMRFANARRLLVGLFVALCVVALAWRVWLVSRPEFVEIRTYYSTDTRFDSILFGCLLALWRNPARLPACESPTSHAGLDWLLVAAGAALLLSTVLYREPRVPGVVPLHVAGHRAGTALLFCDPVPQGGPFRVLNLKWLARIGVLSYGIYLIHRRLRGPRGEPGHRPAQSGAARCCRR